MRKFTLFLSFVFAFLTASAQEVTVTNLDQLSNDKTYFIESARCFLMYNTTANADGISTSTATNLGTSTVAKDWTDVNQQFKIENIDGNYYLYSVGAAKYVTSNGGFSDTATDALGLTPASDVTYNWLLTIGGNGMNSQEPGQMAAGIVVNSWTTEDLGNRYKIIDAEASTVVVVDYPNEFSEFEQNKCYTVSTTSRGGWAVANDAFCSTNDAGLTSNSADANQQFAVLSNDGENYYLYSVGAKKFVKSDKSLIAGRGEAIELADASSIGECRVRVNFKGYTNKYINLGGSKQMIIDGWSAVDAGNAVAFIEAGEFDPTEALAMLNNVATITYKFQYEGNVVATQEVIAVPGEAYPDYTLSAPYGVTGAAKPEGTVSGDETVTIELTITKALPFEAVAEGEPAKWYYAQIHGNSLSYMTNPGAGAEMPWKINGELITTVDEANADSYTWGFVGNLWTGFKMVSKAGGAIKSTGSGNVTIVENLDEATAFIAMAPQAGNNAQAENGFCLLNAEAGQYINAQNVGINHWTANDAGSTIVVTEREITVEPEPVALAVVSQTPAADEVVESFNSITIEFNKAIEFIQAAGGTGGTGGTDGTGGTGGTDGTGGTGGTSGPAQFIKLMDANGGVAATAWVSAATIDGNKVTFVFEMNAAISKTGNYSFAIPAGLIKATDGEEFAGQTFTFQVEEPAPALAVVSQTPAADEVVESFNSITIEFNKAIEFIQAAGGTGGTDGTGGTGGTDGTTGGTSGPAQFIKLMDANGGVAATAWVSAATIDGNKVTFVFEMNATISKTGNYSFAIPAGLIKATDGEEFAGQTFTFQVEEPAPALAVVSQTPAADEAVESFNSITIEFNKAIEFIQAAGGTGGTDGTGGTGGTGGTDGTGGTGGTDGTTGGTSGPAQFIKLMDANGGVAATAWVSAATIDGNKVTFVFEMNATISKTGNYSFAIPAGLIKATDGEEFAGQTFTFQVEEPAPALAVVSQTPAADEAVESFNSITIEFNKAIEFIQAAGGTGGTDGTGGTGGTGGTDGTGGTGGTDGTTGGTSGPAQFIKLMDANGGVAATAWVSAATIDGNKVTFVFEMNATISKTGNYSFAIPAGLIKATDGEEFAGQTFTFQVEEPAPALAVVSQTPAADEAVESFNSITIEFNKAIEFIQAAGGTGGTDGTGGTGGTGGTDGTGGTGGTSGPAQFIKLMDANGGVAATAWVSAATIDGNKVTFVFEMNAAISKTGNYSFAIPAGLIKATDGEEFAGQTFTFQVEEPAPALAVVSQTPAADEVVESFNSITIEFNKAIEFIQAAGGTGGTDGTGGTGGTGGTDGTGGTGGTSGPAQFIKLMDANGGVAATAWVSAATIDGNKVTFVFEMNATISKTGNYSFAIPAGLIKATDGEEFAGQTFTFQVEEAVVEPETPATLNETVVFDFVNGAWGIPTIEQNNYSTIKTAGEYTDGKYTINIDPTANKGSYIYDSKGFLQLSKTGSKIILPAFNFAVEKIEVVGHASATSYKNVDMNVYVGSNAVSTACVGSTATYTYEIAADKQAAGNVYELIIGSNGGNSSSVMCITYIKVYPRDNKLAAPEIDLASGVYIGEQIVNVHSATADLEGVTNVTYYYTTNGNEPTVEDEETDGEITIENSCTLKVIVELTYGDKTYVSASTSAEYIISEAVTYHRAVAVESGNYFLAANGHVAAPLANNVLPAVETTIDGDDLTEAAYYAITLEEAAEAGTYYIKDVNGNYIYTSSMYGTSGPKLSSNGAYIPMSSWTITVADDENSTATIVSEGLTLVYDTAASAFKVTESVSEGMVLPTFYGTQATGVENVVINGEAIESIYDLNGRKLEKVTKGGIYIIDGKKVLVK